MQFALGRKWVRVVSPRLGALGTVLLLVAGLLVFGAGPSEAAPTTYFQVDAFASTVSEGQPVDVRVRARDDGGDVDPAYVGTVRFSSTDPGAVLPPDYTFTATDAGDHTFAGLVRFSAPGNHVLTVTAVGQAGVRGDSHAVLVFAGVVTHLDVDASGGSNSAGQPIGIRVRARSDRGDVVPGYRGTIRFTSTDPAATLPADYTFTADDSGDHSFPDGLRYATAGSQSISAFDVGAPAVRGESGDTVVSTTGATQLDVDTSGGSTVGQPLTIRVRARDDNGNVVAGYRGTIRFTSTDQGATLPADYTFTATDNGDHQFTTGAKYATPGNQAVTAFDTARPSLRGDSGSTLVHLAAGTYLDVDTSVGSVTAGQPVTVRVRAYNERGDLDTGYQGTVHLTSTDPAATLPVDYTFTAADKGDKSFTNGLRYATAGNQSVSAADTARPAIRGDAGPNLVYARAATSLQVTSSTTATAGQAVNVRIRAVNDRGDVDTGYRGTVRLTSTDPAATLAGDYTFTAADNGDRTISAAVTFATAGSQSVRATDTSVASLWGRSDATVVGATAALAVDVFDETPTAGRPGTVSVTAVTPTGARDGAYRGTVRLTSTDPAAVLPAEYTFTAADNGRHDFSTVAFGTAGTQTVEAADTADAARRGSETVYVHAAAATYLEVQVFASDVTAGRPATVRIRARNANGDIDAGYRGTVHFTSTDPAATLPADYTFTATDSGDHMFTDGVTYVTPGSRGLSAADTAQPSLRGDSGATLVASATATYLEVQVFSSSVSAGEPATLRIRARNSNGDIDTGYRGTVRVASSDPAAGLPAQFTFTAGDLGDRTFTNGVTYNTAGSQSVSAVDIANTTVRGDSGPTLVLFVGATYLEVQSFSSDVTAGHPVTFRIRARNANGDIDTGYRGTVRFTSSDAGGTVPADYTFTAGDAGVHTFTDGATFATAGNQAVSAADTTRPVRGGTGSILVYPAGATHLDVEVFVSTAGAGEAFDVRVTARNDNNDVDTAYRGTVHFSSTDPAAVLPADYTFTAGDGGRRTFTDGASLATAGSHTLSAADTAPSSTVRGFSGSVVVAAGPPPTTTTSSTSTTSTSTSTTSSTTTTTTPSNVATRFDVEVFASQVIAGRPVDVRVTARDAAGAIATGYRGTVHLTSTDTGAVLAAGVAFTAADNGRHTFTGGVRFGTAGNQRVTATDTASPSVTGQSGAVLVFLPDATHFDVEIFTGTVTAGQAVDVRVTARNDINDIDQGYRGSVRFTSTDTAATLPADYTFTAADAGRRTFTAGVAFATPGTQRVSATETTRASVTGTSGPVTVQAAVAVRYVVAPSATTATSGSPVSVQVTAQRADGSTDTSYAGIVRFTSTDTAATLPADYQFVAGDNGRHTFSVTFQTSGNQTVTATAAGNPSVNGTSPAVLVNAPPTSTTSSTSTSTSTTSTSSTTTTSTSTTVPTTTTTKPPCSPPTVNVQPSTMRAGDAVTVSGCGFGASKTVQIQMFSTPVFLGQTTANGSGLYSMVVVIPADATPGNHTIVASGQNGESVASEGSAGIFVSGPPLEDPGTTVPPTTVPPTTVAPTTVPPTTVPPTTAPAATTTPPNTTPPTTAAPSAPLPGAGGGTGTGDAEAGTGTGTGTGTGALGTGTGMGTGTGTGAGVGAGIGTGTGAASGTGTDLAGGGVLGGGLAGMGSPDQTTTGTIPGGGTDPAGGGNTIGAGGGNVALGAPGGVPAAQAGGASATASQSSRAALQPRPGFEEQSELVTAVPTPSDLATDAQTIAANVLLAVALILLIGFPADIFNSTLLDNYDEVRGWFRIFRRRTPRAARTTSWFDRLPTVVRLAVFGLIGSILYGLLDPSFGFNRPSLILVLGLMLAIATISTVLDILRIHYHRRVTRKHGRLRAFPLGLVMAGILVFFSRIGDFHPGYVFGVFTALAFEDELHDEEDGRGLAIAGVGLLVVAILALVLRAPLDRLAGSDGAGFWVLVLDAALATLWVAGIQAVIWGLIPIKFMYGQKVLAWNKLGWLAIYGTGMLLFVHTLLHPGMGLYGNSSEANLFSVTLLFVSFGAFSLLFWGYFRFRRTRPPAVTIEPVPAPTLVSEGAMSRFDRLPPP